MKSQKNSSVTEQLHKAGAQHYHKFACFPNRRLVKSLAQTLLVSIMIIAVFTVRLYARSQWKLWLGTCLVGAGTYLVIDGFRQIHVLKEWDVETSNPEIKLNYSWSTNIFAPFQADASGAVINTGNVALYNVKIHIKFYDADANLITSDSTNTDNLLILPVVSTDSWSISTSCGDTWPGSAQASATYDYTPTYEHRSYVDIRPNNETMGIIGITCTTAGLYFLIDYVTNIPRVASFLEENQLNIKIASKPNSITLLASKML